MLPENKKLIEFLLLLKFIYSDIKEGLTLKSSLSKIFLNLRYVIVI